MDKKQGETVENRRFFSAREDDMIEAPASGQFQPQINRMDVDSGEKPQWAGMQGRYPIHPIHPVPFSADVPHHSLVEEMKFWTRMDGMDGMGRKGTAFRNLMKKGK